MAATKVVREYHSVALLMPDGRVWHAGTGSGISNVQEEVGYWGTNFRSTFRLTSPPSSNIAPPGNYLLFAIDDRGVPSIGRFIRIDRQFVGELKQEAEEVTFSTPFRRERVLLGCGGPLVTIYRPQDLRAYGGIDFGTQKGVVKQFSARVCGLDEGTINVRLDRPDGPQIATLQISPSGFVEQTTSVVPVEGVHNIFITYVPPSSEDFLVVDLFKFKQ